MRKKELTEDDFTVPETADYNYGAAVEVEIVSDLELDVDYTVRYDNNIEAGAGAKVTISGKGNYGGTLTCEFAIVAAELSSDVATIEVTGELSYPGEDSVQPKLSLLTSTCSVVCPFPQAYFNKLRLTAIEALGFHSLWRLEAHRKGMVITMPLSAALSVRICAHKAEAATTANTVAAASFCQAA